MERCELCKKNKKLLKSHIIPKFFFKYLKKTSPISVIRFSENMNILSQDGLKMKLLCEECEQIFSNYERIFSNEIFNPVIENKVQKKIVKKEYEKFIVSIIWRSLIYTLNIRKFNIIQIHNYYIFLEKCRGYFLDGKELDDFKVHMIPLIPEIEEKNLIPKSRYINQRIIDVSIKFFLGEIYIKIPYFLFIFNFYENEEEKEFLGTEMKEGEEILNIDKIKISRKSYSYLETLSQKVIRNGSQFSIEQKEKRCQRYKKILEKYGDEIKEFEVIKALNYDLKNLLNKI